MNGLTLRDLLGVDLRKYKHIGKMCAQFPLFSTHFASTELSPVLSFNYGVPLWVVLGTSYMGNTFVLEELSEQFTHELGPID